MTRPNLNAVALVAQELEGQIASTGFDVLRPVEIDSRWLFNLVRSGDFVAAMAELVQGALYPAVRPRDIRGYEIPVAPLNEQKRIANKLDSLLARVDACRERLDRVPLILNRFRQAALAAATSGVLTEEWREEHWVDRDWSRNRIGDITTKVGSGSTPRGGESAYNSVGVPLIRSMNVVFYGFKRDGLAYLDNKQAKDLRNVEVKSRDVLLNITGASIGRVTLAPSDLDGARVNQHVCIIRPTEAILPEFLCAFLSAPLMQNIIGAENYGVTRQALTKQQILDFEVPTPTINEQHEIVRRVETLFAFADRLEARYNAGREQVEQLTPSILDKAFRGELVPQDPNDEPGEELLERILGSKAMAESKPKEGRKQQRIQKVEVIVLDPSQIRPDHLSKILKKQGRQTAKSLWQASQLGIEDFYEQLRTEEAQGLLREIKQDAESYLEAA